MYARLIRPILFKLPPEAAHRLTLQLVGLAGKNTPLRALLMSRFTPKSQKKVELFGLTFPNHVGLAAGYDKDAQAILGLSALGFGHIEVGTITPQPQSGNPKPRIFRLTKEQGIINRMGFPGKGADYCRHQLAALPALDSILGINIGKNKDTPLEEAAQDYSILIDKLSKYADYFAINISSPNTVGLRQLQHKGYLDQLLKEIIQVREQQSNIMQKPLPLLVKLSPDMDENHLNQALEVILSHQIEGIIATNTTVSRNHLHSSSSSEQGGLSGKPLRKLSTRIISHIHKQTGGKIPIIGVGGISSPQDAQEKFDAGASLVQLYTGLIYRGPLLARQIVEVLDQT
ncbi:MAG: quinone-dependent dihydroorotate dehydrogenase [candidate division Zixibacteria bacterium]|nr:quinone-dependent dihydroorotate dehydrogenase [Gammaproteobacteria bacterium]NIX59640.1 quinone-dependent dihydroorotate dehydrogenase [candidate division Zixibacteria bacterium]